MKTTRCTLCLDPMVDSFEMEGGDDANFSMTMNVCEFHLAKFNEDENAFASKYGEIIDTECYNSLIDEALELQ